MLKPPMKTYLYTLLLLIFVSLREQQTPAEFSARCEDLAAQFHQKCQKNTLLAIQPVP